MPSVHSVNQCKQLCASKYAYHQKKCQLNCKGRVTAATVPQVTPMMVVTLSTDKPTEGVPVVGSLLQSTTPAPQISSATLIVASGSTIITMIIVVIIMIYCLKRMHHRPNPENIEKGKGLLEVTGSEGDDSTNTDDPGNPDEESDSITSQASASTAASAAPSADHDSTSLLSSICPPSTQTNADDSFPVTIKRSNLNMSYTESRHQNAVGYTLSRTDFPRTAIQVPMTEYTMPYSNVDKCAPIVHRAALPCY